MGYNVRILHVITTINRGGAENHLALLVAEQVKQGHQIGVVYLKGDGYWESFYKHLGVAVHKIGLSAYADIRCAFSLKSVIDVEDPQVVHAHMAPAELYCYMALMIPFGKKRALVCSKHNDAPFCPNILSNTLETVIARRANRIIAISSSVQQTVAAVIGSNAASKLRLVYYGFERREPAVSRDTHRAAVRTELGIPEKSLVVGSIGRFVEQKAFDILIRGYAEARKAKRWRDDGRLLLVGQGPLEGYLKRVAREAGIAHEVVWPGFREDVYKLLQAIDIFVLPSRYEGLGLVLLEAMSFGLPVIGSRISAIPEVIGDAGILVPAGSVADLANAIESLLEPEHRNLMGKQGLSRLATFGLERMVSQTETVYCEALDDVHAM